ncbi:MAG: hypothetical protein JXA13_07065 [Anaerolineales bacterium]|nr:hypothetical protein [Anaerolineales bacterium]
MTESRADQNDRVRSKSSSGEVEADILQSLDELALHLARQYKVTQNRGRSFPIIKRLQKQMAVLQSARTYFTQVKGTWSSLSYAVEWLLDNFYVIEQAARQVREDMPWGYYYRLPKLDPSISSGAPRVYELAHQFIQFSQSRIDLDNLVRFVRSFQKIQVLRIGEIWAFPTMLRLGILENLSLTISGITSEDSAFVKGSIETGESTKTTRPGRVAGIPTKESADDRISPDEVVTPEMVVANCIMSLRVLSTQDWKVFFEEVSLVNQILRRDPAGVYAQMDFETRNRYRSVVEKLAQECSSTETEIADTVVRLAADNVATLANAPSPPKKITHVGYYLIAPGYEDLKQALGYRENWRARLRIWLSKHVLFLYLSSILLMTGALVGLFTRFAFVIKLYPLGWLLAACLAFLPTLAVSVQIVNQVVLANTSPRTLPRFEFKDQIPVEYSTVIVVPTLLGCMEDIAFLLRQLELHYLANTQKNLYFVLLTDFIDAPEKMLPGDTALLDAAQNGIEKLNANYEKDNRRPFYLLHRERKWNPGENCWMGWERKRGKLSEFNKLLLSLGKKDVPETNYLLTVGHLEDLAEVRYVVTLDADTMLPLNSVSQLVATLAHPLNRAEFDPDNGLLISGYSILQPRTQTKPNSANASFFASVFSPDSNVDLYSQAVSDVYQDLFGEGSYYGKGIYDVNAFERTLAGRVPENTLLSHDLFEGIHGRVGYVSDITFYEDFPPNFITFMHRMHRWIRGDWQLLPWLSIKAPHTSGKKIPNDLSLLDIWKIIDNLRRSLMSPAILAMLFCAWLVPGATVWLWMLLAVLPLLLPILQVRPGKGFIRAVGKESIRSVLTLMVIPYRSLLTVDAISTTLVRMYSTHKKMLQWVTASHSVRLFGSEMKLSIVWNQMAISVYLVWVAGIVTMWLNLKTLPYIFSFLFLWLIAPFVASKISSPRNKVPELVGEDQQQTLRNLARRTWLFFEQFVGPDNHWLPPDHYQDNPHLGIVHHTSPTNIGVYLLSTLAAYDFGFIGFPEISIRLQDTLESFEKLELYRGHLLNWYDTQSLKPLSPRYVSVVDSGNLGGSLLVLQHACTDICHTPVLRWERLQGFIDILEILREESSTQGVNLGNFREQLEKVYHQILCLKDCPDELPELLGQLCKQDQCEFARHLLKAIDIVSERDEADFLQELYTWIKRAEYHIQNLKKEIEMLMPWIFHFQDKPALFTSVLIDTDESFQKDNLINENYKKLLGIFDPFQSLSNIPETSKQADVLISELLTQTRQLARMNKKNQEFQICCEEAITWCNDFRSQLTSARLTAGALLSGCERIRSQAEHFFSNMDFNFLLDPDRQVFHIGYNLDTNALDQNHYDLLASEARLASIIAIAKGDVPSSHWLHMARPTTEVNGNRTLLSWSGTMFEYLMPNLFLPQYPGTLLFESCQAAVTRQINYGEQKNVPWGISESSFYSFDDQMGYQYQAFGVPGLGLKRGLGEKLVIAPYACMLALSLHPKDVLKNIDFLNRLGMLGRYGFYESIDFTPTGQSNSGQEIVYTYMAHHQGMIMVALANYLGHDKMIHRMARDRRLQSVALLLQERPIVKMHLEYPHPEDVEKSVRPGSLIKVFQMYPPANPWHPRVYSSLPLVHCLSNGQYSLLLTNAGGGYSRWKDLDLTRWRNDTTQDDWGSWVYLQDIESGTSWIPQRQPSDLQFYPYKVAYQSLQHGIRSDLEITVSPVANVEIRWLTITNQTDVPRRLAVTSFSEVVLAAHFADSRHQAFNKLFVESELIPDKEVLIFKRRTRTTAEKQVFLAHYLLCKENCETPITFETDRANFLGRCRTPLSPAALDPSQRNDQSIQGLSCSTGATLDAVMAIRQEFSMESQSIRQFVFITLAAGSRDEAMALVEYYQSWSVLVKTFDQALARSERELARLELTSPQLERIQKVLSALVYPHPSLRSSPETLAKNQAGQSGLWPYSVSGDYPILLVKIESLDGILLVHELVKAHSYWRSCQIKIDLVVLNMRDEVYNQELQDRLRRLVVQVGAESHITRRGGIFLLQACRMGPAEIALFETAALAVLDSTRGTLAEQLSGMDELPLQLPHFLSTRPQPDEDEPLPILERPADLLFDNGLGGFSAEGREYVIYLENDCQTPAPWINVIANPSFGFITSESGLGYTWAVNSGENRLTPWRNDPVANTPSEIIYLRDEDTGQVWTPTPAPVPDKQPYLIRHGAGYSIYQHNSSGLKQQMRVFASPKNPVKLVQLQLENTEKHTRRIMVTFYAEWVLGAHRETMEQFIVPEFDATCYALLARNPYNEEFQARVAFLAATREPHSLTTDRTEFLGRLGSYHNPAALNRIALSAKVEAGVDPCAAMSVLLWVAPGDTKEVTFLLGQGETRENSVQLIHEYRNIEKVWADWNDLEVFWDGILGQVSIDVPDLAANLMVNRWLIYQGLACRVWGRSALYQSSGAYGFRDQLQDVMALVYTAPDLAREHILESARHQFIEGDVLHWWHPPAGRGIRSRCSDDLLWLPFVTSHYLEVTGDITILDETVTYLTGDPLDEDEPERYGLYASSQGQGTLFEHCCRALEKGNTRGEHGLPLIGSGDWNDGMNLVGSQGQGESVWLGWFLAAALKRFANICEQVGEESQAKIYRLQANEIRYAIEANGWDGQWYLRGYYDNGEKLGSASSQECQIDSIAQSWAVLSGSGDKERYPEALEFVAQRLVRLEEELILLFTPPFDASPQDPGYIKGYPPGVRENGGQYTHAAAWTAWAFAMLGQGDRLERLLSILNPIKHADTPDKVNRYRVEPYVVAADIYGRAPYIGRGGWTWYTGSAGWLYRLYLEACLGLKKTGRTLRIDPCVPADWPGFSLTYRYGKSSYHIHVENPERVNQGVVEATLDGEALQTSVIHLADDGKRHEVTVRLGAL